jgi:hypothetical protein
LPQDPPRRSAASLCTSRHQRSERSLISGPPLEALFTEYAGNPFGPKIKWFKEYCDNYGVSDNQKAALQQIYKDLEELRVKRNFIVHAETWDGAFKSKPRQPYRIGLVKDNVDYLDDFEHSKHGENVFDVKQVRAATQLAIRIRDTLVKMREDIVAGAVPQEEEPDDPSQWPPPANSGRA